MISVVAVVLTYNRKNQLLEVLDALQHQDSSAPDILVIDNHSTDGTKEAIASYLAMPNVHYEDTGENLGGAGGFNYAMRKAATMGYERLWIMDDDCVPEKGALTALRDADRELNGQFGWLSSRAYWTDGSLCKLNIQGNGIGKKIKKFDKELIPALTASFVSLYVHSVAIYNVGLNIKDFEFWYDDWEFSRRISKNYKCYVASNSCVVHKAANNVGSNIALEPKERLWRYKYGFRNEVYIWKHEGVLGCIHLGLKVGYNCIRILVLSRNDTLKKLKILFSSTLQGLKYHPEIEYIEKGM